MIYATGLLKNAHLLRCAAILVNRRTQKYASFLGFCAPYIWTFLNSPLKIGFFNGPTTLSYEFPPTGKPFGKGGATNHEELV